MIESTNGNTATEKAETPPRPRKFNEPTQFVKLTIPVSMWEHVKDLAIDNDRSAADQARVFIKAGLRAAGHNY